ncbi:hypothetical protein K8T06_18265 [bacterium]|nr:hypothetical protein [bacterium]
MSDKRFPLKIFKVGLCAGFAAMTLQLCLIRETLVSCQGNELSVALVLGLWLLFSGLGSLGGQHLKTSLKKIVFLLVLISAISPITVAIFRLSPLLMGTVAGEQRNPLGFLATTACLLFPICILNGILFAAQVKYVLSLHNSRSWPRWIYAAETAGAISSALLITFLLPLIHNTFFMFASVIILIAFLTKSITSNRFFAYLLTCGLILMLTSPAIDQALNKTIWQDYTVLDTFESPNGRYHLVEYDSELTLFENLTPVAHNEVDRCIETMICLTLLLQNEPENVIILEGALSGAANYFCNIKNCNVQHYCQDSIPLDYLSTEILNQFPGASNQARKILQTANSRYIVKQIQPLSLDIFFSLASAPTSLSASRLLTDTFFQSVNRSLKPGGVYCLQLPGSENMANPQQIRLYKLILNSLLTAFERQNILFLPGDPLLILIQKNRDIQSLHSEWITSRLDELNIPTSYPQHGYIPFLLEPFNREILNTALSDDNIPHLSSDDKPVIFSAYLDLWQSQWQNTSFRPFHHIQTHVKTYALLIVALFSVPFILSSRRKNYTGISWLVGMTGGTVMLAETMLLFQFQIVTGALYRDIGLLIALLAAGLAAGSIASNMFKNSLHCMLICQTLLGITFFGYFLLAHHTGNSLNQVIIYVTALILGLLGGCQFGSATLIHPDKSSLFYFADLMGASFATFFLAIVFLPAAGFLFTALTITILNCLSVVILTCFAHR